MNLKVAIVDDEPKIVRFIKANLLYRGYKVETFSDGKQFLDHFDLHKLDLVLLDVMMPNMDGFTVLNRLRKFSNVPVIILTARSDSNDLVEGFELGADDYLTKPFSLDELFARVKAVLRRSSHKEPIGHEEKLVAVGGFKINLAQKRVFVDEKDMHFTNTEYLILEKLAIHADKIVSHEQILVSVWGEEYKDRVEYLRVAIARIRKKLKDAGCTDISNIICTYPGIGYSFITKGK
ncbi:DNA-binding response regulator [Neobacillus notoginsengisoli]|uniref:DNA-binding response regulator n=1 Tax=Neobacillus notoginsengisoli TaxID=1578198 RepID=A0A417YN49_9BACI|nr:response regulator transcription factor [Neobacillus notoginsengisoli]RHW34840.1 DNA-binding response regulator [Neobacillus notoginsengisoli]